MMFRTALLRTAKAAVARPAALPARRFVSSVAMRPVVSRAVPARAVVGARWYSAGGGLQKEEVEGRVMSLLQGFDKVSFFWSPWGRLERRMRC